MWKINVRVRFLPTPAAIIFVERRPRSAHYVSRAREWPKTARGFVGSVNFHAHCRCSLNYERKLAHRQWPRTEHRFGKSTQAGENAPFVSRGNFSIPMRPPEQKREPEIVVLQVQIRTKKKSGLHQNLRNKPRAAAADSANDNRTSWV